MISLVVMLGLPVVRAGFTGMDPYGLFALEPLADRPWSLVTAITLSGAAAGLGLFAHRMFRLKRWFRGTRYEAYHHNAIVLGAPVGIAFTPAFLLASYDEKPACLAVACILATALCLIATLNERESSLDANVARLSFVVGLALILIGLASSITMMLFTLLIDHSPPTGNFFWSYDVNWNDLGYPAEEFNDRYRNGLLAYLIASSCYMSVAIGGCFLGVVLGHIKGPAPTASNPWPSRSVATRPAPTSFMMSANGQESVLSPAEYENLLAQKESLLPSSTLLVDKASGTAFSKDGDGWKKAPFRGKRTGPFLLLCIYARHPGRRFTTAELQTLLEAELPDRDSINVSDILGQLMRRASFIPVQRDAQGSYIPEDVNVCFLDRSP